MADQAGTQKLGYFASLLALGVLASAICAAIGIYGGLSIFRFFNGLGFNFAPYFEQFFPFIGAFLGWLIGGIALIWMSVNRIGRFVGGHAAVVFLMFFIPIIAANVLLATNAIRTFPGLEVENSYVASQEFNKRKAAQEALGWTVEVDLVGDELIMSITDRSGAPVKVAGLNAVLGRPTEMKEDRTPAFVFDGKRYVAPMALKDGNWDLRLVALAADGTEFRQRLKMHIK